MRVSVLAAALALSLAAALGTARVARAAEPLASGNAAGESAPCSGQPADVSATAAPWPMPLTHYRGREIAVTMHYLGAPWLTREEREREEECSKLLAALKIKPGQVVCDLGCGNGFYALPLAKLATNEGLVYAVDIQREMLEMLAERAKDQGVSNIRTLLGTPVDPQLPAGRLDLVLLVDVYHELSNPEEMLAAIRRSLRPTGRMVLVEFRLEDPNVPIKLLHKMSKQQILAEILPNGFKLVEQFDDLPWQHVMFFESDDAAKATLGR